MIGRTISHYTVLEKLGAGGMGEIYKAQDTRLNRFVAMKVLSTANAGDVERRRRFVQEAQAASALNHPNIITIHDVVSTDGLEFMVMEFVSGATLDDLIPKHGLNVQKSLDIAVQMADALQTAHAAGIVHRDLKPANVMVTGTGLVKILDFGIAKLTGPSPAAAGNTDETLPIDSPMTVEGSILGTVCYMSPEQAQAKAVDPRSDIFSFGLVLYEMLTGQKAFSGDSALSTLSSILRDEAKPIGEVVEGVPTELEQIVHRAMRKSPDERWQSMQEMRAALLVLKQKADSGVLQTQIGGPAVVSAKKSVPLGLIIAVPAVAVLLAAGGGTWWWMKHRHAVQPPPPVAQATPAPAPVQPAPEPPPASTPADTGMSNQDVLGMVGAKVPVVTIIDQIRAAAKTNFDLSTNGIIDLTKGGVSAQIIEVMRNPKAVPATHSAPATTVAHAAPPAPPPPKHDIAAPAKETPAQVTTAAPPPAAAQPAPVVTPAPTPIHINTVAVSDGKPFNITLAQDVPSKLTAGEKISFTITNDVKVGDIVVIPKGTPVAAQVVDPGESKKVFGILGKNKATFKLTSVDSAGGGKLAIRALAAHTDKPEHPLEALSNKSKDVLAHAGTEYMGYIDGDQTVTIKH